MLYNTKKYASYRTRCQFSKRIIEKGDSISLFTLHGIGTCPPAHPIVILTRDSCETGELASDSKLLDKRSSSADPSKTKC